MALFSAQLPALTFGAAIRRAASIAPARGTVPIVGCVLMQAKAGAIHMVSTDMNQAIDLEVEAAAQGTVAPNAARMVEIAARLDNNGTVQFQEEAGNLMKISQGRTSYRVPLMPADDFPGSICASLAEEPGVRVWDVSTERLVHCLEACDGSVSVGDMTRPALGGAYFDFDHETDPRVLATTGHILTSFALADMAPPRGPGIIIPHQAFKPICDFAKRHQSVKFFWTDQSLCIEAPRERFRTRLIGANYPDLRGLIPNERPIWVKVETAKIKRAVDRASIIEVDLDGKKQGSQLQIDISGEELIVSSYNQNGEEAVAACECARLAGDDYAFHVNAKYMAWAIASLGDAPYLNIGTGGPNEPDSLVLVHRSDDEQRRSLRGLMPVRSAGGVKREAPAAQEAKL